MYVSIAPATHHGRGEEYKICEKMENWIKWNGQECNMYKRIM